MDINLNDELLNAGKEVEDTFAAYQRALGKYQYLQKLVREMTEQQTSEADNDFEN